MRLRDDPNAQIKGISEEDGRWDTLRFTCPAHGGNDILLVRFMRDREPFRLDKDRYIWRASGEFPDTFTLQPSVHVLDDVERQITHWHGHVSNGVAG